MISVICMISRKSGYWLTASTSASKFASRPASICRYAC